VIEVWFVRHGQTDWNIEGRVQGWTDVPLNRTGIRQAHLLANALHGIPFQVIYSSDLSRAKSTAAILQAQLAVPLRVDARLRERYFGRTEGMYRTDNTHGLMQKEKIALASAVSACDSADDRETDQEVRVRANSFLKSILDTHLPGRILCVSHGGFIRVVLSQYGWSEEDTLVNTGVTKLAWSGKEWRLASANWANHLRQ
jgi:2,3-bisphosphoglycerate-dependent phosphoglycerate mutase